MLNFVIDSNTPCRTNECFFDDGDVIEIVNDKGSFKLNGIGAMIWRLLDGKHTVKKIVNTICSITNSQETDEIANELENFLLLLEKKGCIIMNWNPSLLREIGENDNE